MTIISYSIPVVTPANKVSGTVQGHWTYIDYAALPDDGRRYEIIDGVLYMTPAPTLVHQSSNGRFYHYLFVHVELADLGKVYHAPCDVELAPNIVVQPDVIVVLNANLGVLTPTKVVGAPDLVVEVVSPGTASYDRRGKQDVYARFGVREYWIADPEARIVELLVLENDVYRIVGVYRGQATLPSQLIPNLPVRVEQFFA